MDIMLVRKLFLFLTLIALTESVIRVKHRQESEDCSCDVHYEEEPCVSTVPTTTTVITTTTTTTTPETTTTVDTGCPEGSLAYLRKSGYWCELGIIWKQKENTDAPMSREWMKSSCASYGMIMSSVETKEEWDFYYNNIYRVPYNVTGLWVAAEQDPVTKQYYWSDGYSIKTMDPQPVQNVTDGYVVYYVHTDPSTTLTTGYLATTNSEGSAGRNVNMGLCGKPGRQFS